MAAVTAAARCRNPRRSIRPPCADRVMSAPEVWGAYVSTARRAGKEHETSSNDCGSITCTWDARGGIVASAHYSRRVHSHWLLVLCFACLPLSATADPSGPSAPHVRPTD